VKEKKGLILKEGVKVAGENEMILKQRKSRSVVAQREIDVFVKHDWR